MSRILGGAALEVGSYFIPGTIGLKAVKGLTKAMSPITKMLVTRLGKKISNKLIQNAAESIVSEPIGSIGQSIENGEDIITESTASDILQDMTKDMVMNSVLPFYRKYNKGKVLKKYR